MNFLKDHIQNYALEYGWRKSTRRMRFYDISYIKTRNMGNIIYRVTLEFTNSKIVYYKNKETYRDHLGGFDYNGMGSGVINLAHPGSLEAVEQLFDD